MSGNPSLLVIDDEEVICEACRRILSPHGFLVETSTDAINGLFRVVERDYSAVLLDIKMAPLDGIQVLDHIRKIKPGVPVIVITGHPNIHSAAGALRLGAADYVTKPFSPEDLIRVVHNCLQRGNRHNDQFASVSHAVPCWVPADGEFRFWNESWLQAGSDGSVRVGSVLLHSQSGEIEGVRLPRVGETVYQGLPLAALAVQDAGQVVLPAPVSGVVMDVHTALSDPPSTLTGSPLEAGWLARICPSRFEQEVAHCQPRRVVLVNAAPDSARRQREALSSLGCSVRTVTGWNNLTAALLDPEGAFVMLDAKSFGKRGPELVRRINVVVPSMKIVVVASPDSRFEASYRKQRILYYAVNPFLDNEIVDILDAAFRSPGRARPGAARCGPKAGTVTSVGITNGTGRRVSLIAEGGLLRRNCGLCGELADRLSKGRYRVEMIEGGNEPVSALAVREATRTCDRLLVLVARDTGRLPGSLVRDTTGEFTSELCDTAWNVTPLVVQPDPRQPHPLDFDAATVSALATHVVQEMVLCYQRPQEGGGLA